MKITEETEKEMIVKMTNEVDYSEITKKLEEIFTSEQYDLPVLYDAIRCINVQAQEIEVLKSMLKTLEENYDKIEASLKEEQCQSKDWADRAAYYLGQYEKVSEHHERLIDTIRKIEYDVADKIITKAIQDISKVYHHSRYFSIV